MSFLSAFLIVSTNHFWFQLISLSLIYLVGMPSNVLSFKTLMFTTHSHTHTILYFTSTLTLLFFCLIKIELFLCVFFNSLNNLCEVTWSFTSKPKYKYCWYNSDQRLTHEWLFWRCFQKRTYYSFFWWLFLNIIKLSSFGKNNYNNN